MNPTNGHVAVVTGGNSGIGKATALAFAEQGTKVVIAARRQAEGEQAVSRITEAGLEAMFVQTDVSHFDEVQTLVDTVVDTYGRLDYAFNNAAIPRAGTGDGSTAGVSIEEWDEVLRVNLRGVWLCMKAQIPVMTAQGGGSIVNTASLSGCWPCPATPLTLPPNTE